MITLQHHSFLKFFLKTPLLSKIQHTWGMKCCLPDLSETQRSKVCFFVNYVIDKFVFFHHRHECTHIRKKLCQSYVCYCCLPDHSEHLTEGERQIRQKLAVHYTALGKEKNGFFQCCFLQSKTCLRNLAYVCYLGNYWDTWGYHSWCSQQRTLLHYRNEEPNTTKQKEGIFQKSQRPWDFISFISFYHLL